MATIDRRPIIDNIIVTNGASYEEGEPAVVKIVEYTTFEGNTVWGIVFASEVDAGMGDRYEEPSAYVNNPRVIWRRR